VDIRGGMARFTGENAEPRVYNTQVLVDNKGNLQSYYRKSTHLMYRFLAKLVSKKAHTAAGARAGPMRFNNGTYLNMYVQCGEWDTKLVGSKDDKLILYALIASTYTHTGRLGLTIRR
jgi:hypothetical protein